MRRFWPVFCVMLLLLAPFARGEGPSPAPKGDMAVGTDIGFSAVTDFYYTYETSTAVSQYQRYRFYVENGERFFYHETRAGGSWPQTEEDITVRGTVALTQDQWDAFCDLIRGGTASPRTESLDDGDFGPWLFIYWAGGEAQGREFSFKTMEKRSEFEEFCAALRGENHMRIKVSDGKHAVVYQLNDSPSAHSLYAMLPLEIEVEDYGSNEKIFYPEREIDAADGIEGGGGAGDLALFSPWGNVVMYYGPFTAYPGLYLMGQALEGADQVGALSGTIRVEAAP